MRLGYAPAIIYKRDRNRYLAALRAARETGLITVGFTGSGANEMRAHCDHILCAPSEQTAIVQQIYLMAAHAICGVVERELFGRSGA